MAEPPNPIPHPFLRMNPQQLQTLPTEILSDILSRLPAKQLLRYKCVNKEWYSLISSTHFINLHLHRSLQTYSNSFLILSTSLSLFLVDLDNPGPKIPLKKVPRNPKRRENPKVVGTCNGLLCIKDWSTLSLYNPTTQKCCFKIPDLLAECFGFGYDSVSDDYKLLAMDLVSPSSSSSSSSKLSGNISNGTKVFSLRRNEWKVGPSFSYVLAGTEKHAKFSDNALHWLVEDIGSSNAGKSIVAFELHGECYNLLGLPELGERDMYDELGLLVLGGDLCVQVEYLYEGGYCLDVWAMKEYGLQQSWTKLFKFPYEDVIGSKISMKALAYSNGGRKVLLEQDSKYYWYQFEGLMMSASLGVSDCFAAAVCVGTLVSLADFQ